MPDLSTVHRMTAYMAWADDVVLLERGQVVARGDTREVIASLRLRRVYGVEVVEGGGLGFEAARPARAAP